MYGAHGQQRRLSMIVKICGRTHQRDDAGKWLRGGNVCGKADSPRRERDRVGIRFERAREAKVNSPHIINAAGEFLPLPASTFDLILSHEVIEHVQDDRSAIREMIRVLKVGGRRCIFLPEPRLSR
jgi:SAM-dependent methyltransferase